MYKCVDFVKRIQATPRKFLKRPGSDLGAAKFREAINVQASRARGDHYEVSIRFASGIGHD